jgi:tRNA A-37 threonylcarbamoyl transferase component Bud32
MICPRCSVAEISPLTGRCELCGYAPTGGVAVQAPRAETVDELARRELADTFRLDVLLGLGATSAVYLAREKGSERLIVVKALPRPSHPQPEADERLHRAVEAIKALDHPHIVPVFACGTTEHICWYSMEHVHGQSLRRFTASRGSLDVKSCHRIVAQIASALDYAHRRGVVHGALKPENVLIDDDGWIHVCDPLVTRALQAAPAPALQAQTGLREEPPPYVAPEDAREGLRTPFSDQYALAVLVYECLTGSPPPEPPGVGIAPASSLAAKRPDLAPHVVHAVRRAMSPRPADRFPSILDFVAALETYTQTLPDARPTGQSSAKVLVQTDWKPPVSPVRRRVMIAGVILGTVALAVVLRPAVMRVVGGLKTRAPNGIITAPASDSLAGVGAPAESVGVAPAAPAARGRLGAARPSGGPGRRAERRPSATLAATAGEAPGDSGRLFVNATPWGQVFVDNRPVGNTPKANLKVAPGRHTIRVVRDGFAPFERTIQVSPGQEVRLTDIVLVQQRP